MNVTMPNAKFTICNDRFIANYSFSIEHFKLGNSLECGGRAQRRHRFSNAATITTAKAAWRFASRRNPKCAASPPCDLRVIAAIQF
jgi:hypothetical protein